MILNVGGPFFNTGFLFAAENSDASALVKRVTEEVQSLSKDKCADINSILDTLNTMMDSSKDKAILNGDELSQLSKDLSAIELYLNQLQDESLKMLMKDTLVGTHFCIMSQMLLNQSQDSQYIIHFRDLVNDLLSKISQFPFDKIEHLQERLQDLYNRMNLLPNQIKDQFKEVIDALNKKIDDINRDLDVWNARQHYYQLAEFACSFKDYMENAHYTAFNLLINLQDNLTDDEVLNTIKKYAKPILAKKIKDFVESLTNDQRAEYIRVNFLNDLLEKALFVVPMEIWTDYLGYSGPIMDLPEDIRDIMESECPFSPPFLVKETHLLRFIPNSFDLDAIQIKIENPMKPDRNSSLNYVNNPDAIKKASERHQSGWILFYNKPVPGTEKKDYEDQLKLLESKGYRFPYLIEAAICISGDYVALGDTWPVTNYTTCMERTTAGGVFRSACRIIAGMNPYNQVEFQVDILDGLAPNPMFSACAVKFLRNN